ncbi:MAG: hypothetical protein QW814_03425 [Methanothrix sp.]
MPIKYNITKYDVLVGEIHRLAQKYNTHHTYGTNVKPDGEPIELTEREFQLKAIAVIIASFSSGHSWQTHKCIESEASLDKPEVKDEYLQAEQSRWKSVNLNDVEELAVSPISDQEFYRWLFYNVDKKKQKLYKEAWVKLKTEFDSSCDELEQSKN